MKGDRIPVGDPNLPPPGDERREELGRRADDLAEAIETQAPETERIRPDAFKVIPEIRQQLNELEVSDADPNYVYKWVFSGRYSYFIKMALTQGWEVVQGEMPEAIECKGIGTDTTRRIGDVILMRTRVDNYVRLRHAEKERADRLRDGVSTALSELGRRYSHLGVKAGETTILPANTREFSARRAESLATQERARREAEKTTDQWIREGRMPGAPVPGR